MEVTTYKKNKTLKKKLINLEYNCSTEDRFIYTNCGGENEYFDITTPFLKVLKPIHNHKNKSYIILEINQDLDVNDEIGDLVHIINKVHACNQDNIAKESKKWFCKSFDVYDLDTMVKRPIEERNDSAYIKLIIPEDNEALEEKISLLKKGDYVRCHTFFKGLKISREALSEEWILIDFESQNDYDLKQSAEYNNVSNSNKNILAIENIADVPEETICENTIVENTVVENTTVEETVPENTVVENTTVEETVPENIVENTMVEQSIIEVTTGDEQNILDKLTNNLSILNDTSEMDASMIKKEKKEKKDKKEKDKKKKNIIRKEVTKPLNRK